MSKFSVAPNLGQGLATTHESRIWLQYSTSIKQEANLPIPLNSFKFQNFNDILYGDIDSSHYIDVVGEFVEYHPIRLTKQGSKWTKIEIENQHGERIICTVWDPYTDEITDIVTNFLTKRERPILVLQFVQKNVWNGNLRNYSYYAFKNFSQKNTGKQISLLSLHTTADTVKLTTTRGATRILVNPDIPEVHAFKTRKNIDADPTLTSNITQVTNDPNNILAGSPLKTLNQINNIEKAGIYVTVATIFEIDSNTKWYYESCKICRRSAKQGEDGLWRCKKPDCLGHTKGMKTVIPRYRVKFTVADGIDSFAEFMMFDNHIAQLLPISAAELLSKQQQIGDKDAIPRDFAQFIKKEMVAKIKVSQEYNIDNKSISYTVVNLSLDEEVIARWRALYKASKEKNKSPLTIDDMLAADEILPISNINAHNCSSSKSRSNSHSSQSNSQSSDETQNKTPQKRPHSRVGIANAEDPFEESPVQDQGSRSKMILKIKKEKNQVQPIV